MNLFKGLLLSAGLLAMTASASQITQTQSIPAGGGTLPTDVLDASGTFELFGSIAPAGSILDSVTLEIVINESLTALTLTNSGTMATSSTHYIDQANFDANDTQDTTDATNLDAGLSNSLNQGDPLAMIANISAGSIAGSGGTFTCTANAPCSLPRTLTVDSGVISGTTASYTGTGTFDLQFSTDSSYQITGFGGNNVNPIQTNMASAVATVIYNYTDPDPGPSVPEPATLMIFGSGLLAMAFAGKKLVKK